MKAEIFRDRTLTWFEKIIDSPMVDRVIWCFIGFVGGYFLGIVVNKIQ